MADFSNLFSALFNCFAIIIFGYIAGRTSIITPSQANGVGNFVGFFALPALLLKNMIELNFDTVSWTFMLAVFLAKTIVFITVLGMSILVLHRKGVGKGAIYAIFATQSNDFAMGEPIVNVLYHSTHPELIQYIYLLAPISLLILNPIGMLLLEIDKQWRIKEASEITNAPGSDEDEGSSTPCEGCSTSGPASTCWWSQRIRPCNPYGLQGCSIAVQTLTRYQKNFNDLDHCNVFISASSHFIQQDSCQNDSSEESPSEPPKQEGWIRILLRSLKSLFLNPIVSMVFLGLIFHFIFNRKIPTLLDLLLKTLANAFSAAALFYLGLNMVGKIAKQTGVQLLVPAGLIAAKILLVPIIAQEMVFLLNNWLPVVDPQAGNSWPTTGHAGNGSASDNQSYVSVLSNFAFLYGTFPTAPSVFIYAAKYGVELEVIASAMVVCTTLSAPMMYISAWTLSIPTMDNAFYKEKVALANQDISIIGALCAAWCIAVFFCTKKFQRIPHFMTTVSTVAMFLAAFMTVICDFVLDNSSAVAAQISVFFIIFFSVSAARFYAAALALCLVIYKYHGEAATRKAQWYLIGIPPLLALLASAVVVAFGKPTPRTPDNPIFMFGRLQDIVSFVYLVICLLVCLACMVSLFRIRNLFTTSTVKRTNSSIDLLVGEDAVETNKLIGKITDDDDEDDLSNPDLLASREKDEKWFRYSSGDPQLARHVVLLMFLCVSMLIGVVLTGWQISKYSTSGIYFEIGFLDAVCNFGQAFFVFLIFGLDEELILDPLIQLFHRCTKGNSEITLLPLSEVDQEVLKQCHVFVTHHYDHCRSDLLCRKRHGLRVYSRVLTGTSLCSWLVEVGLASDRNEAIVYGRHLMQGRVLQHVNNTHHFYDKDFLYQFETRRRCNVPLPRSRANSAALENGSQGRSGGARPTKCKLGPKQFSFERFLNDATISGAATPRHRRGKVIKHIHKTHYDTQSFCSDEDPPQNSLDTIISVAQSTADIAQDSHRRADWTENEAEADSRQDHDDLMDW